MTGPTRSSGRSAITVKFSKGMSAAVPRWGLSGGSMPCGAGEGFSMLRLSADQQTYKEGATGEKDGV